jgi:hypothetical protein
MTHRPEERGSVSLWLITASFAMVFLVGLAVDLGGQVHAQQRAHDLAAEAARAGGQEIQAAPAIAGTHLTVDVSAARSAAEGFLRAAHTTGAVTVSGGDTLTVRVTDTYQTRFLGVIGINRLQVTGEASARLIRALGGAEQ